MATETSSIDDLLMSGKTETQPEAPEHRYQEDDGSDDNGFGLDTPAKQPDYEPQTYGDEENSSNDEQKGEERESPESPESPELDEYGNEKPKPRLYTEEEKNEAIRLAIQRRIKEKHEGQATQQQVQQQVQQVQQAQQTFNYDADSDQGYIEQFENHVEQVINKINQRQLTQQQQNQEKAAQEEFQDRFTQGMDRFGDFKDVVGTQYFSNPMTYALRGMKDPAAFAYAASKRHPQELQRIAQIQDPYAQMVEMGKLEERMRKSAPVKSNAPKPVSRSHEDAGLPQPKKKDPNDDSIEDLIAKSDARRQQRLNKSRGKG